MCVAPEEVRYHLDYPNLMRFSAAVTRTKWDAIIVAGWLVLTMLLLLRWVAIRPTDSLRFVLICIVALVGAAAALVLYGAWGLLTLEYRVDLNAVRIYSRRSLIAIPLTTIRRVVKSDVTADQHAEWWRWPASFMRAHQRSDGKALTMLATRPLRDCVLLDTGATLYALSPTSNEQFLSTLQSNYRVGPLDILHETDSAVPTFDLQMLLGVDVIARRILWAGLLGVVLLFVLLLVRYPFLPETMAVRFDRNGIPELVRDKSGLFLIPMIGMVSWIVNGLWGVWMVSHKQLIGAYLLWSGAVVVQFCLFFALLSLVR